MAQMASEVVIDTSALVAILTGQVIASRLLASISSYERRLVGTPTLVEATMVLVGRYRLNAEDIASFLRQIGVEIVPFDANHAEIAGTAFQQFGKGKHSASLNFGDCCSYSVAKAVNAPLLFVGEDFGKTDLKDASSH